MLKTLERVLFTKMLKTLERVLFTNNVSLDNILYYVRHQHNKYSRFAF